MTSEKPLNYNLIKKLIDVDKTETLRSLLNELDTVEIVNSLLQLKLKHQLVVLESLSKDQASEVLTHLQYHAPILSEIVTLMNAQRLGEIIEEMEGDDAADIVSILNEEKADEVLENLPSKERQEITTLMQYDQESAGGIMNPDVVSVLKDQTIDQAIQSIRVYIEQEEMKNFYAVYVTDENQHLIGKVSLPQLLLSNRNTLINELMNPNVVAVDVDMDQEEVARIVQEYNLVVVPVIDKYLKLIGRITSDDVMHVLQDEYQEDIAHIAGTGSEAVLETSVIRTSRDRLPWLILGLIGGILAASAMSGYEKIFHELPQIMYFVPLIAALGGNIAIQSSSIVVRGLGTGQIRQTDLFPRLWKEIRVSSLNGPICAGILFLMAWFLTTDIRIGVITGIALVAVVMMATIVGSAIPIILKRINIDPAIATGPFITTANDLLGILIYLSIALALIDFPIGFS